MAITYSTDELVAKNAPTKPKKPKVQTSKNGKAKGLGTKPVTPPQMKAVNSTKPAAPQLPGYNTAPTPPKAPTAPKPASTPAPANPSLPGYAPNPTAPKTVRKAYTVEEIEKMGLLGIGGMIAGGLGRAKAAMPRLKLAGKQAKGAAGTALGADRTAKIKGFGDRMAGSKLGQKAINRYSNVSPAGGKWNKKLIARDAAIGTAGLGAVGGAGYMMAKSDDAQKAEEEARLRDIRVGTASNLFGAGMGALATYQAGKAGKEALDNYNKKRNKKKYVPKTKAGKWAYKNVGSKMGPKAIPALIIGGGTAAVAGQALNGAMDANSARVFMNEDAKIRADQKKREEGLAKAVEIPTGNGMGMNLKDSWFGKSIAYGNFDEGAERHRKNRNRVANATTAVGIGGAAAGTGLAAQSALSMHEAMNPAGSKAGRTESGLRRVAADVRNVVSDAGSKKRINESKVYTNIPDNKKRKDGTLDRRTGKKETKSIRQKQGKWAGGTVKDVRDMRSGLSRRAGLAALGAGVAYAGSKFRTD